MNHLTARLQTPIAKVIGHDTQQELQTTHSTLKREIGRVVQPLMKSLSSGYQDRPIQRKRTYKELESVVHHAEALQKLPPIENITNATEQAPETTSTPDAPGDSTIEKLNT